jgi:hypothetical protein
MTYRDPRGRKCIVCELSKSNARIYAIVQGAGSVAARARKLNEAGYNIGYKSTWRHIKGQHTEYVERAKQELAWRFERAHLKRREVLSILRDFGLESLLNSPPIISGNILLKVMRLEREEEEQKMKFEASLKQNPELLAMLAGS